MVLVDFLEFRQNLQLSRKCVAENIGVGISTIYRWEKEQKAPLCAILALEMQTSSSSIAGLSGWHGWSVTEHGIVSPRGHAYFLDEIEPTVRIVTGLSGSASRSALGFGSAWPALALWVSGRLAA